VCYVSRGSGELVTFPEEANVLCQIMSKLTRAKYEIRSGVPNFPPEDHEGWFVFAPKLGKTAYARKTWGDKEGNVFIESMYLGDTGHWVETEYGERGAIAAFELDYSDFDAVRKILAEKFPLVEESLRDHEKIVAQVASKHKVDLRMRYDTRKGGATVYLHAKIEAKGLDSKSKIDKIRLNVGAMKEAWRNIERYEAKRRRS